LPSGSSFVKGKSEVGGRRAEVRRQKTGGRIKKSEGGRENDGRGMMEEG